MYTSSAGTHLLGILRKQAVWRVQAGGAAGGCGGAGASSMLKIHSRLRSLTTDWKGLVGQQPRKVELGHCRGGQAFGHKSVYVCECVRK